jgi:hypothetical protein
MKTQLSNNDLAVFRSVLALFLSNMDATSCSSTSQLEKKEFTTMIINFKS